MRFSISLCLAGALYVVVVSWSLISDARRADNPPTVASVPITILPVPAARPDDPSIAATEAERKTDEQDEAFAARPTAADRAVAAEPLMHEPEEEEEREAEPPVAETLASLAAPDPPSPEDPMDSGQPEDVTAANEPAESADLIPRQSQPSLPASHDPELPDDLMELPDLLIAGDLEDGHWETIDKTFGIETLAYSIDGVEPTVFLLWDDDGQVTEATKIDRRPFSNRCRDRTNIHYYRRRLIEAKRRHGISRPMRVVGLVPNQIDRQFAAAQIQAIRDRHFDPENVRSTIARYAINDEGGCELTIDEIRLIETGTHSRRSASRID